jgi:hypothetical protein
VVGGLGGKEGSERAGAVVDEFAGAAGGLGVLVTEGISAGCGPSQCLQVAGEQFEDFGVDGEVVAFGVLLHHEFYLFGVILDGQNGALLSDGSIDAVEEDA